MSSDGFLKRFSQRTFRVRRHLSALARYGTPRRYWNIALTEAERVLKRDRLAGRPYILLVDPVNACNLRCPCCPTGRGDLPLKTGKMPLEGFRSLVDQIAPHTVKMMLYNWGEPFLHKDILPMIRHAHENRIATGISSNLNILPEGGAEAVVASGLDDLIVSCDGLEQSTYEQYRVRGNVETVLNNMKAIADAKRRLGSSTPVIEFQYLVFAHNEHEVDRVEETARGLGANFVRMMTPYINFSASNVRPATNPKYRKAYYEDADSEKGKIDPFERNADLDACAEQNPPPLSCFWPWRSMVINWNGQVDPCCFKNYHDAFGNAFEMPFEEIWNGAVYRDARRWIAGKPLEDPKRRIVCRGCAGYR